jgi:hypothetical protein
MHSHTTGISAFRVWQRLAAAIKQHPVVIAPFIFATVADLGTLAIVYYSPQQPFSWFFGPFVRAFWGERFMHYPSNFALLPHLYQQGKTLGSFFFGIVLTALTVSMVTQAAGGVAPGWGHSVRRTLKKFLPLLIVWCICIVSLFFLARSLSYSGLLDGYPVLSFCAGLIFTVFAQMIFAMTVPFIILEGRPPIAAAGTAFALLTGYPLTTGALIAAASILLVPSVYLQKLVPGLVLGIQPDVVLYVLCIRVLLMAIITYFTTASAAILLALHAENAPTGGQ